MDLQAETLMHLQVSILRQLKMIIYSIELLRMPLKIYFQNTFCYGLDTEVFISIKIYCTSKIDKICFHGYKKVHFVHFELIERNMSNHYLKVVFGATKTGPLFLPELLRFDDKCNVNVPWKTLL